MTEIVATLISVKGPRLMYSRRFSTGNSEFFLAYAGAQIYLYDVFQTDENTSAIIQFHSGKQIRIEPKKRIAIASRDLVTDATFDFIDPNMRDLYKYQNWKQFSGNVLKRKWLLLQRDGGRTWTHRG